MKSAKGPRKCFVAAHAHRHEIMEREDNRVIRDVEQIVEEAFVDVDGSIKAFRHGIATGQRRIVLDAVVSGEIMEIDLKPPAAHESARKAQDECHEQGEVIVLPKGPHELNGGDVAPVTRPGGGG